MGKKATSDVLAAHYKSIIEGVGEDVSREGLLDTPARAAKAILSITSGYEKSLDEIVNGAVFESGSDEMVLVKSIENPNHFSSFGFFSIL